MSDAPSPTTSSPPRLSPALSEKRERLLQRLAELKSCAVAFSAGVDSTVVARAAWESLGSRACAVTAVSPSLASGELEQARSLAQQIGIRHLEIQTSEMNREGYRENSPDRCYHCKTELYEHVESILSAAGVQHVVNGANLDDLGDHRPGMRAAAEHGVLSPLIEAGIDKAEVRQLAAHWGLPVWDKPASPCLSSRIAYGEEVTEERLRRIDAAEQALRELGLSPARVRLHRGELARIEVPASEIAKLAAPDIHGALVRQLKALGFHYVTLDLEGFRSGSMNELIQLSPPGNGPRSTE